MKRFIIQFVLWSIVATSCVMIYKRVSDSRNLETQSLMDYSDFIERVRTHQIDKVRIDGQKVEVLTSSGQNLKVINPGDTKMIDDLLSNNVRIKSTPPGERSVLLDIFISWFPMFLLIAIWVMFMRRQGGMGGAGQFGKSKAKMLEEDSLTVKLADVAGCEEAKEEVAELVDFLKEPQKYQQVGGKIPTGILMVGPPGTGKTLLARAIAGEAGVKFFSIAGSDFVEMFVGVGASRVRDMFAQAKEHAPCIIFIDEIDAVGRQRQNANFGGGSQESEQTLNALLVEMDGFTGNEGIIVIAATNRADVLDKALLRPGRFDRQVTVGLPDIKGREQILNVHIKSVPVTDDINLKQIARGTPGFSGAELANLVNEASLFAARANKSAVSMVELEKAKDKMIMGVERRTAVMNEDDKRLTAYHEAGHCIVGQLSPNHDPVYKVSIMPRGRALGVTMFLPEGDEYSASKSQLESQLASLYGGRIAELMIYGGDRVTTGASNDIERATELARKMVTRWGFSDVLGPLAYGEENGQPMFGYSASGAKVSDDIQKDIDKEIRRLIDTNYKRAETLLQDNIEILHKMADALMKWETIDKDQIDDLMAGREPREPAQ